MVGFNLTLDELHQAACEVILTLETSEGLPTTGSTMSWAGDPELYSRESKQS